MPSGKRSREIRKATEALQGLPPEVLDLLLSEGSRSQILAVRQERISQFSGPLPPPEILAQYEQVSPGAASALIEMAQSQMRHRQKMEDTVVTGNSKAQGRGQHYALLVTVLAFLLAGYFAYLKQPVPAGFLSTGTVVGLVGLFVTGKYQQGKERKEKDTKRQA